MQFGFSYVGLVFLFMLMVPNMLWTKPVSYTHLTLPTILRV